MHFVVFHILISLLPGVFAAPATNSSTGFIVTTKVTPSYWRATFSNPPLNIETANFFADFFSLIDQVANDAEVKVLVFDSAVPDFWLGHFDVITPPSSSSASTSYWGNITKLVNLPVLTVASIRGIVRGGGLEIASALDVRFGSKERAILGQPEVGFGTIPGGGGLELIPRLTGRSRALEIIIGADDFDADTAALYGLINRAIPDAKFEKFIDTFARRVAGWDQQSITTAKQIINNRSGFPTQAEFQEGYDAFGALVSSPTVLARITALVQAGLQLDVNFEKNLAKEMLKFVGNGPFKSK